MYAFVSPFFFILYKIQKSKKAFPSTALHMFCVTKEYAGNLGFLMKTDLSS